MRARCFLPRNAADTRRRVSTREATPIKQQTSNLRSLLGPGFTSGRQLATNDRPLATGSSPPKRVRHNLDSVADG